MHKECACIVGQVHSVTSERAQIIAMVLENVSMGHVRQMNTTKVFRAKSENANDCNKRGVCNTTTFMCSCNLAGKKAASDRLAATAGKHGHCSVDDSGLMHIVNVKLVTPVVIANTRANNATVMGVVNRC